MIVPGPQICCRYEMCTARPWNEHSQWKLRSRDIGEKAKQNSARNNAKCFQFLCNNSDRTWFFNALTFARSLERCWKPRPSASVFNTSHGTWRMLMHEKPCLIPIFMQLNWLKEQLYTSLKTIAGIRRIDFPSAVSKDWHFLQHLSHFDDKVESVSNKLLVLWLLSMCTHQRIAHKLNKKPGFIQFVIASPGFTHQ